ncbi:MAG: hypothetical protein K0S76_269 [Herbinix sp.]|jgi:cytochrome c-type biogenesis protein|nr:hypothetical protein [Herbinix sp.]
MGELISIDQISFILVFIEGLLSFFSPCVIPLIPIYMSYLAGNAKQVGEDGVISYRQSKVFFHTICFVIGISSAFFLLGISLTTIGTFFQSNRLLFTRLGAVFILIMGLIQVGLLDFNFLQKERKIHLNLFEKNMNPLIAVLLGFTFSFAWTPCVGPALSSVLILASGTGNKMVGNLLVLLYTLGFILPFLLLGLFTAQTLNFLKKHQKLLKYTVKVGGAILILIGIMTFTGWMNGITRYLSSFTPPSLSQEEKDKPENDTSDADNSDSKPGDISDDGTGNTPDEIVDNSTDNTTGESNEAISGSNENDSADPTTDDPEPTPIPAYDFTLTDQYGNEHTLSDYKGKVVFLNFWATWCSPCQIEMPDIEELYAEYNQNTEDVIILGVANPESQEYPKNVDISKEKIITFLEDNNYTFPVVFDVSGEILKNYYISAFPTTFMIDKNGNIYGYVSGMLTKDIMHNIIRQTMDSTEE